MHAETLACICFPPGQGYILNAMESGLSYISMNASKFLYSLQSSVRDQENVSEMGQSFSENR